jgi:hypothetical protein
MLLNAEGWVVEPDPGACFDEIVRKTLSADDQSFLRSIDGEGREVLLAARSLPLPFYHRHRLVEIEVDLDRLGRGDEYRYGALYAVLGPEQGRLLNGKSQVIHELNRKLSSDDGAVSLDLSTQDKVADYLRFFGTFVANEGIPFMIVDHPRDLRSGLRDDVAGLEVSFETLVARRRQDLGWVADPIPLDEREVERLRGSGADALEQIVRDARDHQAILHGDDGYADLLAEIAPIEFVDRGTEVDSDARELTAIVWYLSTVFRSTFRVSGDGIVEMTDDVALGVLPYPTWRFVPHEPILAVVRPRRRRSGDEVRTAITGERLDYQAQLGAPDVPHPPKNLRIEGDLDLTAFVSDQALELFDVEIDGDLVLRDVRLGARVRLDRVKIAGRFLAPGLRCTGLEARMLRVAGLHERGEEGQPSVVLRAAAIDGDLDLSRAIVRGALDLSHLTCSGAADLSGIEVAPRQLGRPEKGIDLSHCELGGDVIVAVDSKPGDPTQSAPRRPRLGGGLTIQSGRIGGALSLGGLHLPAFELVQPVAAEELAEQLGEGTGAAEAASSRWAVDTSSGTLVRLSEHPVVGMRFGTGPQQVFRAALDLRSVRVEGSVDLGVVGEHRCEIASDVLAGELEVGRDILLDGARIGSSGAGWEHGGLHLRRARMGGLFCRVIGAHRCEVTRDVDLHDARVEGDASLWGARIGGGVDAVGLSVAGSLDFDRHHASGNRTEIGRNLMLSRARIGRSFTAIALVAGGDVDLSRAHVDSYCLFSGAEIGGTLRLLSAKVGDLLDGNCWAWLRTRIGGDLVLSGTTVGSDVRFTAVQIGGVLLAITGSFRRIQIRPDLVQVEREQPDAPGASWRFRRPQIGSIVLHSAEIESLDLYGVRVREGVELSDLEISDSVTFFAADPTRYLLSGKGDDDGRRQSIPSARCVRARIRRDLEVRRVKIGANLDLSNLRCLGAVRLHQLHVEGDLHLRSTPHQDDRQSAGERRLAARLAELVVEKATIGGDAVMSGMVAERRFCFRGVTAGSDIRLARSAGDGAGLPEGGAWDFSGSKARRLMVRGDEARKGCLVLERSDFELVELQSEIPRHLNLGNSRVGRWTFSGFHASMSGGELAREVLARSSPFDRTSYLAIERWLRLQGDDSLADEVHKDMRWRALHRAPGRHEPGRYQRGFLQGLGIALRAGLVFSERGRGALAGALTGFWTDGARILVWGGLITLCLSLTTLTVPENLAPGGVRNERSESTVVGDSAFPRPEEWTRLDSFRLLIKTHVPIIPLTEAEPWLLAHERPLLLRLPVGHELLPDLIAGPPIRGDGDELSRRAWRLDFLSPAGYGLGVRLLHWVAWPLALVGVAANLERRRGAG